MKPNYCIAIAVTKDGESAVAVSKVYKDVIAAATKSKADRVDIYRNGSYEKTIRPSGLKALQDLRAKDKAEAQAAKKKEAAAEKKAADAEAATEKEKQADNKAAEEDAQAEIDKVNASNREQQKLIPDEEKATSKKK